VVWPAGDVVADEGVAEGLQLGKGLRLPPLGGEPSMFVGIARLCRRRWGGSSARALYSVPEHLLGSSLDARVDSAGHFLVSRRPHVMAPPRIPAGCEMDDHQDHAEDPDRRMT
jgi:hypothetical protein